MVGIRELRQNLSAYVRRVRDGEHLVVTERGRPVARLEPLDRIEGAERIEHLISSGVMTRPVGDILDLDPVLSPADGRAILDDLAAERGRTFDEAYGDE